MLRSSDKFTRPGALGAAPVLALTALEPGLFGHTKALGAALGVRAGRDTLATDGP